MSLADGPNGSSLGFVSNTPSQGLTVVGTFAGGGFGAVGFGVGAGGFGAGLGLSRV